MNAALLELSKINKSFYAARVLQDVSLSVRRGRVLGLIGENGAGKSTLMNILGGVLAADSGAITFLGKPYRPTSPRDASALGLAFIHQELNLFTNLSVAENIFLGHFPRRLGQIDRRSTQARAAELLGRVGLELSPGLLLETLSAGERQLVEIAKALSFDAKLIILDEPTTSLTERETARLFELLDSLRQQGMAMIYISHALNDVRKLCDEVVVLRDGEVVGQGEINDFELNRMVSLMVGRDSEHQFPQRVAQPTTGVVMKAESLSQPGVIENVSFELHRGEVLGISGLMGSGRTELARILFGLDRARSGDLELDGQSIRQWATRRRINHGMAMLTESRRDDGLCMDASIFANMALVASPRFTTAPLGWLRLGSLGEAIAEMRRAVRLTTHADNKQAVRTLSGGNQQKVVLAKWLLNEPQVLILDEPTRGIDVGAKYEIYGLIDQLASRGAGILIISSELDELIGVCDRMLVMSRGEIRDVLNCAEFDRERIMKSALPVTQDRFVG